MYCFSLSEKTGFVIYFIQATPFILIVICLKTKCNKGMAHLYQKSPTAKAVGLFWQGHKDLNPEPTVLEMMPINRHLGGLPLKC